MKISQMMLRNLITDEVYRLGEARYGARSRGPPSPEFDDDSIDFTNVIQDTVEKAKIEVETSLKNWTSKRFDVVERRLLSALEMIKIARYLVDNDPDSVILQLRTVDHGTLKKLPRSLTKIFDEFYV